VSALVWIIGHFVTVDTNSKVGGTITDEPLYICVYILFLFAYDSLPVFLINEKVHIFQEDAFCVESYDSLLDRPEAGVQISVAFDWFRRVN
jgi:hypothetical protein